MKGMDNILPESETTQFEDRIYGNPQVGVDQTNSFIDNYRANQTANNQQIAQQTANLGTEVPSALGGLNTGTSYWTSRFQTPQSNSAVADLRATAQAQALNEVLSNEEAKWKKRYTDAYRDYQSRQWNKTYNTGTTGGSDGTAKGGVEYEDTGGTTGLNAVQDTNQYDTTSTVYDSTQQHFDNRSTESDKKIEVTKDSNGNVSVLKVNGSAFYGREARAKYRYLKNAGLVR